ncbi:MAG: hypothetical protein ABIJ97_00565 [Bacteroidota bacterium]
MKNKGGLFILMGLILSLLILGFAFKINSTYLESEKKTFNQAAITQIKNKYSNLNSIKDFYREGTIKSYFERIVPFSYEIDENTIGFTQELPAKKVLFRNFFDYINAYKIFIESDDALINDKIDVSVETIQNSLWGGTDENIVLMIKPQCKKYSITDHNSMYFYGSDECAEGFDIGLIKRIDINISVPATEDYNWLACSYGGDVNCHQEIYVPGDANPFIEINLLDSDCPNCDLNSDTRKTSKHFNPLASNSAVFSCVGASCASEDIEILFNENNTIIKHSGTAVDVKIQFLFTAKIEGFELSDFNLTLTDDRFNIRKTNK